MADPICSLPRLDSPLLLGASAITLIIGITNKSIGLLKVPGSVWTIVGAAGLGLGLYQKLRCP